jgi:hypothetical protein
VINKRGQSTGQTWLLWLVIGIVAVVLIAFFLTNGFGFLEGASDTLPGSVAFMGDICKQGADRKTVFCAYKPERGGKNLINCEDPRISSWLVAEGVDIDFNCDDVEEANARAACANEDWVSVTDRDEYTAAGKTCEEWLS